MTVFLILICLRILYRSCLFFNILHPIDQIELTETVDDWLLQQTICGNVIDQYYVIHIIFMDEHMGGR